MAERAAAAAASQGRSRRAGFPPVHRVRRDAHTGRRGRGPPASKKPVNKAPSKGGRGRPVHGHMAGVPQAWDAADPFALVAKTAATTLRLLIDLPFDYPDDEYRRFALSLGYALRAGMRHLYMLDGSEIEVEVEPCFPVEDEAGRRRRGAITFIDPALGGTGFLERAAAADARRRGARAMEHLDHAGLRECLLSVPEELPEPALPRAALVASCHAGARRAGREGAGPPRCPRGRSGAPPRLDRCVRGGPRLAAGDARAACDGGQRAGADRQVAIEFEPGRGAFTFADFAFPTGAWPCTWTARRSTWAPTCVATRRSATSSERRRLRGRSSRSARARSLRACSRCSAALGQPAEPSVVRADERYFGDYELMRPSLPAAWPRCSGRVTLDGRRRLLEARAPRLHRHRRAAARARRLSEAPVARLRARDAGARVRA